MICDPACGTCGLPRRGRRVPARHHPKLLHDAKLQPALPRRHVPRLRLRRHHAAHRQHEHAAARRRAPRHRATATPWPRTHGGEDEAYSLILANPPFAGSLDYETTAKDLLQVVKTKKTELLFLALFLRLLKPGGRAAVIVPDGVLFGSTKAHKELRRILVEDQKLDGSSRCPRGVFKPYAGVSTAILLFTKTNSGGTDHVWFYDLKADGCSLDDKRTPLLPDGQARRRRPSAHRRRARKNNLPDALARWRERNGGELERARTDQSFCVPKADIAANGYDLCINRYKEVVHDEVEHRAPREILDELERLEDEIQQGHRRPQGDARDEQLADLLVANSW